MPRAGPQRTPYFFPRRGYGWKGMHSREGWTDEIYQAGYLYQLVNYHLTGRGRVQKRRGSILFTAANPNSTNDIQSLDMYEWDTTRYLLTLAGGKLYYLNGTAWTEIGAALTFASTANDRMKTTQFRDGNGNWMVGTAPGNNRLWKWSGSGNAVLLSDQANAPQYATDVAEFYGRLFCLNTNNGSTMLEWGEDGQLSFAGQYTHCSRKSPGVGLSRHGQGSLLIFHQQSIHVGRFDAASSAAFYFTPLSLEMGCISTSSIVYSRGATYFATGEGFYRITSLSKAPEYIGYPIEDEWAGLNQSRLLQLTGFVRGEPWNEIVWLASKGSSTTHNIAFIWNTELEGWSVFDSSYSAFSFNCGCNFIDTTGKHKTICGDYDGKEWAVWGDDNYDTGDRDKGPTGQIIPSTFETGLLDLGYLGIKRLRELWIDAIVSSNKSFRAEISGISAAPIIITNETIGTTADRLSQTFILGTSALAGRKMPSQGRFRVSCRARFFKLRMTEQNTGAPHTLNSMTFWYLPRAARFTR